MIRLLWKTAAIVVFVGLFTANGWAIDYTLFNNQELYDLRGAVDNADAAEQEAYRKEWQQRLQSMSEEEKKKYSGTEENDAGDGEGKKAPVVLQGKGYEKNEGMIIYGGGPAEGDLRK